MSTVETPQPEPDIPLEQPAPDEPAEPEPAEQEDEESQDE